MWPLRLNHGEPHCGQASLGVIRFSHASPLLVFCHGPEYHKPSKSITSIALPENGDVMMTELVESPLHSRFRYSTLSNFLRGGNWRHPNNGSREYGYFKTWDGWTKFYVRGIDQFRKLPFATRIGRPRQDKFWLSFLEGIGNRVKFYNGKIRYPATKTIDGTLDDVPKCHVPPKNGYGVTN